MKKTKYLCVMLIIALFIGTVPVMATEVVAKLSNQVIYIDGQRVEMLVYNIGGNNYVRLRELGKAMNFSVFYDPNMNSVRIDRNCPYVISENENLPSPGDNISAVLTNQQIYVSGIPVAMTAYNIANNNYVRLRDIGGAINLGMAYAPATDSVYIDTQTAYLPDMSSELLRSEAIPHQTEIETGRIPIAQKVLDGSEWAREDFSQHANPAVFDDVFTRAAYNAIQQSIVDRDIILADVSEDGFNPYYKYANFIDPNCSANGMPGVTYSAMDKVVWSFNNYYQFTLGIEPYVTNRYDYWGYRVCKATTHEFYTPANQATAEFINEIKGLSTDREKVKRINDYVCEKIYYDANANNGINKIFTSDNPVGGACGAYMDAFHYLCQLADIPCVKIKSETHGWNTVFVDEKWYVIDVSANDIAPPNYNVIYLVDTHPGYTDKYPKQTAFAKEILVPGGIK